MSNLSGRTWYGLDYRRLDADQHRLYKDAQMLFFVRWLERHPFIRWVVTTWVDKPWRGAS
jgi:hypothetical protein